MNMTFKGILAAIVSNIMFSFLFFYGILLEPLSGTDIFAWRMVAMLPILVLLLKMQRDGFKRAYIFWERLKRNKKQLILTFVIPTPIMASQLWLFMWAPLHGYGIEVSIGYFLFPLVLISGGLLLFKEKLESSQKIAIAFAAAGVFIEILLAGKISWVALFVCSTYPIYFLIRRYYGVPALFGLILDLIIIFPFVLIYIIFFSDSLSVIATKPMLIVWIIILGLNASIAMQLNMISNMLLPVVLFSVLGYLEPVLLFFISVIFLNEDLNYYSLIAYAFIWLGIAIMLWHSFKTKE